MTCKTWSKISGKFVFTVLVVGFGGKDTEDFLTVWHRWNTEKFKFDFIKNLASLCKAIALDSNPHFEIKKCDKVPTNYNCVSCMMVCNHTAL